MLLSRLQLMGQRLMRPERSKRLKAPAARHSGAALALLALLALLPAAAITQPAVPELTREARIKAVLVLRMIKFVEWPSEALARGDALQICTWGGGETSAALQSLQGQKVREHEVRVRKVQTSPSLDVKGCQVLYVADAVRADVNAAVLSGAGGRAVLTISDMPDFAKRGGIISLVSQDNKMGFEVQLRPARAGGLQIGAPLLELARSVE